VNGVEVTTAEQALELITKSGRRITIEGLDKYGQFAYYSFSR
jgi:hypothetical protein